MTKQKAGIIAGSACAAIILAAGGYWFGHAHNGINNISSASIASAESGEATNNTIPLGGGQETRQANSGLSVSESGASSLGQLNGSSGQNPAGGSGAGSSSSSSKTTSGLNPASFSEYDKYINEGHALFGEIQQGTGDTLTANKKAAVYYKGWLTNGQLFDESRAGSDGKLQPFVFTLGAHQVVPGWEEGLAGMKVGGSRLVIVPPAVGYGAAGQGSVPGNAVMVFQVQLVAVQ
jgi:hypothetical protein